MWDDIPDGTLCGNCQEHAATTTYFGDTAAMGWIHSTPQWWCMCCTLKAQIAYCEKQAAALPGLRAELEAACA